MNVANEVVKDRKNKYSLHVLITARIVGRHCIWFVSWFASLTVLQYFNLSSVYTELPLFACLSEAMVEIHEEHPN